MSYIMIVDDEPGFCRLYADSLKEAGFTIQTAERADEALARINKHVPAMVISDVAMPGLDGITFLRKLRETYPDLPVLLVTAYGDIRDAVTSLKLGAVDYLTKPVDLQELVETVVDTIGGERPGLKSVPVEAMSGIIAESPRMQSVFAEAYQVARSQATVLLNGESGTGKEVMAEFIHNNSSCAKKTMVAVNCAALPENLLGSELFGHEKGAFTGADSKRAGRFREADGSTLFLDEIGDMPLELQASLLRALESGKITPLGSDKEIQVNFRLVAATNKDLATEVAVGRFRQDLFYRLNVIAFELPALRERKEDILPLARLYLQKHAGRSLRLSANALRLLQAYDWPGNIRELSNAMARAAVLSVGELVMPEQLPPAIRDHQPDHQMDASDEMVCTLKETEARQIGLALEKTGGNRTKAAELLGISRRTLIYRLKDLGINE